MAAVLEIAGCYAFWAWSRLGASLVWLLPGVLSLIGFAWLLTAAEASYAGRAFAAYGGIYVLASLAWLVLSEGVTPDRYDIAGAAVILAGTLIIVLIPRSM